MVSEIVSAQVSNNKVAPGELPQMIRSIYAALAGVSTDDAESKPRNDPAVPIGKSVTPDFIVCLEDGKELKMLRRYLRTHFNLSPEQYRSRWGLAADYPMVAPNYSKKRSRLARTIGLGKRPRRKRR